jgi:hypothetical protein
MQAHIGRKRQKSGLFSSRPLLDRSLFLIFEGDYAYIRKRCQRRIMLSWVILCYRN